jgi:hypothetical protein
MVRTRPLPAAPVVIEANEAERGALAARFGVTAIERLAARVSLSDEGPAIHATGTIEADVVQPCAVSGEDFRHSVTDAMAVRFVPLGMLPDGPEVDLEISSDDADDIEYEGESFDLGEAVAQSLGLAIDPYAEGPDAERVRRKAGLVGDDAPSGPLADAMRALRGE